MQCVICKAAEVQLGSATVTLERCGATLVFKHVTAQVCPNCGEEYIDEMKAAELLEIVHQAEIAGVQVDVREYASV